LQFGSQRVCQSSKWEAPYHSFYVTDPHKIDIINVHFIWGAVSRQPL